MMGLNGHSTKSVDDKRVVMDLEASVAGQLKRKINVGCRAISGKIRKYIPPKGNIKISKYKYK
jgi:hypothetical protein